MSSPACPQCQGCRHDVGTSLHSIFELGGVKVDVETRAFTCRKCGCEFKASHTMGSSEWAVLPYIFNVKKKRLSAKQPKLEWK